MSNSYITVKSNTGAEAYVKVTKETGANVLIPNNGALTLDTNAIQKIVDTRKSFEYAELIRSIQLAQKTTGKVSALNEYPDNDILQVIDLELSTSTDNPLISVRNINTTDGTVNKVALNAQLSSVVLNLINSVGFTSVYPVIKGIKYVDTLPNETAADNKTVYYWKKEYYKLNIDEDAFDKLTGTFKEVADLYPFTTDAKENTLYNLTTKFVNKWGEVFERGVYTYDTTTKKATLTELKILLVKKLPEATKADKNAIYVLTRDDTDVENGTKGSAWIVDGEDNTKFKSESRTIVTNTTVPFGSLAEKDVYYIVSGGIIKQAGESSYTTIGNLVNVRDDDKLPNVEKVVLDKDIVYVLTKDSGDKKKGSKYMFNFDKKEFVTYESLLESSGSNTETNS